MLLISGENLSFFFKEALKIIDMHKTFRIFCCELFANFFKGKDAFIKSISKQQVFPLSNEVDSSVKRIPKSNSFELKKISSYIYIYIYI